MLFLPALIALSACLALSTSAPTNPCKANQPFRLFAVTTGTYLAPLAPCTNQRGCASYFNQNSTTAFEYSIPKGTNHLMLAKVPKGSGIPVGLYADVDVVVPLHEPRAITFSSGPPVNMNCTIKQDVSGDGTCDLKCIANAGGHILTAQAADTYANNQWWMGKEFGQTKVKAVFPSA